jgi:putative ABC transport system substrate-binding protein
MCYLKRGGEHPDGPDLVRAIVRRREFVAGLGSAAAFAALSRPFAAHAERRPVIGWLNSQNLQQWAKMVAAFRRGLSDNGFVEGQNVDIEYRWAENHYDRLPALAADLVQRKVDVIVSSGGDVPTRVAKAATSSVPIVFILGGDPVTNGYVASLARPGGNLTGVTIFTGPLELKRLELLRETVPRLATLAVLANPNNPRFSADTKIVLDAAKTLGLGAELLTATDISDLEGPFTAAAQQRADAMLVMSDPVFLGRRNQLVSLAAKFAIPAIYHAREMPLAGGLMSYGTDLPGLNHQLGMLSAKILKGAKPADLPVEQPVKFELVINMKAAKALGLDLPALLLIRATEVIE